MRGLLSILIWEIHHQESVTLYESEPTLEGWARRITHIEIYIPKWLVGSREDGI
jgi:hypothetical protein